jgi:putative DNA methylase
MVWDYAEVNSFAGAGGDIAGIIDGAVRTLIGLPAQPPAASFQLDSTVSLPDVTQPVVSTDPPYYDNIGYADLSDFFYVWLRRALARVFPQLFSTVLTPKAQELIASSSRHEGSKDKSREFFEEGLARVFSLIRGTQNPEYPLTVYYAFKQAEEDEADEDDVPATTPPVVSTGWETMLASLLQSGFSVTGTWPVRTEGGSRMRSMGSNALASSIVLVSRGRPSNAPLATRKQFMNLLRQALPSDLKNLQQGNIAPVDMAQAAIGPGMSVFTRFSKVIASDGSPMSVRTALGIINQVLDEVLAEQEGEFAGNTRWALAWFEQFGMGEGPFGVAEL